jgi:DNA gyrase subunit A
LTSEEIKQPIEDELRRSFIDYSMSVITSRAIPDVRDGLKPVHRRILYTMQSMGVQYNKAYKKSARIVGEALGKYHPHGDTSIYDALSRMAQDFSLRYPLIDGQGNFGSIDGDPPAAMRYTECRMARISEEMLADIDKDTVEWQPNFDNSLKEPVCLPAKLPALLLNGSGGIAVGMVTNIPPHNLNEIADAVILLIDKPDSTVEDLMKVVKGPDFPTGGIIVGKNGLLEAYATGKGSIYVRGKTEIETKGERKRIIIKEIPYQVNKSMLLSQIADLVRDRKITGVTDLRDESDRRGIRVVITLKRDANEEIVLNQLYKHTSLQATFGIIDLALVNGQPRLLPLKTMLSLYIKHRIEVITRGTRYDLNRSEERLHLVEGLMKAWENLDGVIDLIRKSADIETARADLMERFHFSEAQAREILNMKLQQLTSLEIKKLSNEQDELKKAIEKFRKILSSELKVKNIIKEELREIKQKYGDPRRTEISGEEKEAAFVIPEELIPDEPMMCTLTREGYVKRIHFESYRVQRRGGKGLLGVKRKEKDWVQEQFLAYSHDWILFMTARGKVYALKCYVLPEEKRMSKGKPIVNLLDNLGDDRITTCIPIRDFDPGHYLLFATKKGMVKKTPLSAYKNIRAKGIIAIILDNDEVVEVGYLERGERIMLGTRKGKCILFDENEVRSMGRATRGVKGIRLEEGDEVCGLAINKLEQVLTITENGYGKRTLIRKYRKTHRGGKGIKAMALTKKSGMLVEMKEVEPEDELLVTSKSGMVVRIPVNGIPVHGRGTQGVRIMRLAEGDSIIEVARLRKGKEI